MKKKKRAKKLNISLPRPSARAVRQNVRAARSVTLKLATPQKKGNQTHVCAAAWQCDVDVDATL